MFSGHYDHWILSRMNGIQKYVKPGFFQSKTLLELGGGYAHVGNKFHELGALVTTSDARQEHLDVVHIKYPHLNTLRIDAEHLNKMNIGITEKYDIILHWGLLYHLQEIEKHLEQITKHCDILLLETEVSDSSEDTFFNLVPEEGFDQAFHLFGMRPTPSYVERILDKNGFHFQIIKDPILNSGYHHYDWEIKETKTWRYGLRRFWICWKKTMVPDFLRVP